MKNNRYVLVFCGLFAVFCASFILLSYFANPYEIRSLLSTSNNTASYFGGTRTAKAIEIIEGDYDAFILGSSRSEIGINPNHALWGELKTYNTSLAGSNFIETFEVFKAILKKTKKPKLLILSLDYGLFSPNRSTSSDFNLSRFDSSNNAFSSFFKERLSKESIEKSFRELKYTALEKPSTHLSGQKVGSLTFSKKIKTVGQHELVFKTLEKKVINNSESYSSEGFSKVRLELLQKMITLCAKNEIQLKIFISPVHALQLMTFKRIGLWEDFIQWKRSLTLTLTAYPEIPLYDFTNLNSFITEKIPGSNDNTQMQWFWETSHYNEHLGNEVLKKLMSSSPSTKNSFGSLLTEENIDKEITIQREKLRQYESENVELLKKVDTLIRTNFSAI
jgi:hypothetical protein